MQWHAQPGSRAIRTSRQVANRSVRHAPTGSHSAAGTKAAPFKTLARAARAATEGGTTVFVAQPLLAGYSRTALALNFKLSASSPAMGRGIATDALGTDIDGKARSAATGFDLGAFQH